ncbi:hypothetical protein BHE74_00024184 [Ensete ventricosum]|nr:hypothetical protein BHE74_00024184 [Ensete ventricosum]RZS12927.1 hypothetical protein BHM03_00044436 [Ensete ventricosum]
MVGVDHSALSKGKDQCLTYLPWVKRRLTPDPPGWPRSSSCIESMHLGTRQECVRSSPRVSGVCHDDTREFAIRRSRLVGRLSRVAEKLAGNDGSRYSLGIRPSSDDAVGSHRKFAMRFVEGIGKLAGNAKGDRREEDQRTCRKIVGV